MKKHHLERMRAIVAQAIAEARNEQLSIHEVEACLITYGALKPDEVLALFQAASAGTEAEGMLANVAHAGSRWICWNCCGLRFSGEDGVCPNCESVALEIPEDIDFALERVRVKKQGSPKRVLTAPPGA